MAPVAALTSWRGFVPHYRTRPTWRSFSRRSDMPCGSQKRVTSYGIWHLEAYPLDVELVYHRHGVWSASQRVMTSHTCLCAHTPWHYKRGWQLCCGHSNYGRQKCPYYSHSDTAGGRQVRRRNSTSGRVSRTSCARSQRSTSWTCTPAPTTCTRSPRSFAADVDDRRTARTATNTAPFEVRGTLLRPRAAARRAAPAEQQAPRSRI